MYIYIYLSINIYIYIYKYPHTAAAAPQLSTLATRSLQLCGGDSWRGFLRGAGVYCPARLQTYLHVSNVSVPQTLPNHVLIVFHD